MPNIGEGTYGCVYKPPIKCDDRYGLKKQDYKGKVSKLLSTRAAKEEIAENAKLNTIDSEHKYSLENPKMCDPDKNDLLKKVKKYSCKPYNKYANTNEPFSLLLSDYGGKDLQDYCEQNVNTNLSSRKFNSFWKSAVTLFEGIKQFLANDLVHRDIKPSNILIKSSGKMVFIDFGLSDTISRYVKEVRLPENAKSEPKFHWSYPIEYGYFSLKSHNFSDLETATETELFQYAKRIYDTRKFDATFDMLKNKFQPYSKLDAIQHIYMGIEYLHSYKNNIPNMVETSIRSFDSYGMGITLNFMLNCFYDAGYKMSEQFYLSMHQFCMSLCHPNLKLRLKNIDEIITIYKKILNDHGISGKIKPVKKTVKQDTSFSSKTMKNVKSISKIQA